MEWAIRGFPPRSIIFLRGKLLEPPRAGIIATISPIFILSSRNECYGSNYYIV